MRTKTKMLTVVAIAIAVASSVIASTLSPVRLTKLVASVYTVRRQKMTIVITGYSIDRKQCGKTDGITSRGVDGKKISGLAADPLILPYGTRIDIPGVGERIVDDTGGAMRQDWRKRSIIHVDLRFTGPNAKRRAQNWGRRTLVVTVEWPRN